MNDQSKGEVLAKYRNLRDYHARMVSLPRFKDAWADETKLLKRPFKFYDPK